MSTFKCPHCGSTKFIGSLELPAVFEMKDTEMVIVSEKDRETGKVIKAFEGIRPADVKDIPECNMQKGIGKKYRFKPAKCAKCKADVTVSEIAPAKCSKCGKEVKDNELVNGLCAECFTKEYPDIAKMSKAELLALAAKVCTSKEKDEPKEDAKPESTSTKATDKAAKPKNTRKKASGKKAKEVKEAKQENKQDEDEDEIIEDNPLEEDPEDEEAPKNGDDIDEDSMF